MRPQCLPMKIQLLDAQKFLKELIQVHRTKFEEKQKQKRAQCIDLFPQILKLSITSEMVWDMVEPH